MAYILSDIVTRVQQRIRDTGYSSTEITSYINDAQRDIFNEYRFPFIQTTQPYTLAPNVSDITNGSGLPVDYVQALNLTLTNVGTNQLLQYMDIRQIDEFYPDPDNPVTNPPSIPTKWYVSGETIKVYPIPNSAYTLSLQYYKKPTTLSADSDVPEVPPEFEELLVLGASYRVLQVKDNYDQAGVLQNKFDEILQKLAVKYNQAQVGTATRMRINRYALGKRNF